MSLQNVPSSELRMPARVAFIAHLLVLLMVHVGQHANQSELFLKAEPPMMTAVGIDFSCSSSTKHKSRVDVWLEICRAVKTRCAKRHCLDSLYAADQSV